MITGFQYSPDNGIFIGEYVFPDNLDKEEVHLPPNTTLEKPPIKEAGKIIKRVGDTWIQTPFKSVKTEKIEITNYAEIKEFYVDHLKSIGQWSDDDQLKYDQALIEKEQKKEQEKDEVEAANKKALTDAQ
jgi:hypothetical protein